MSAQDVYAEWLKSQVRLRMEMNREDAISFITYFPPVVIFFVILIPHRRHFRVVSMYVTLRNSVRDRALQSCTAANADLRRNYLESILSVAIVFWRYINIIIALH